MRGTPPPIALAVALLIPDTGAAAAAGRGRAPPPAVYDTRLKLQPETGSLQADVDIRLPSAAPSTTFLLADAYRIRRAEADGGATVEIAATDKPAPHMQAITVRRPRAGPLRLRLSYGGPLAPSGEPPLNEISPARVELNLDSFWTPVEATLTTRYLAHTRIEGLPPGLTVVAQGEVRRTGGVVRIDRHVADIDTAFAAEPSLKKAQAAGFEILAPDLESPSVRLFRTHGAGAVDFLTRWFGPMPGAPSRVVVVRRKRDSGYARVGYVVVTEGESPREPNAAKFIAHEFSHAWWAPVDPTTEHRWLQESIAEYVAVRYVEAALGAEAAEGLMAPKRRIAAGAGPILGRGVRENPELYNKGPVLLQALEREIGRAKLDAVLSRLARDPPRDTQAFMRVLGDVAGPEAARGFEAKLRA